MSIEIEKKKIEERIRSIELRIRKAHEFLDNGAHADWHGFKPLFKEKVVNGKRSHPHRDWIRNVFIPNLERELKKCENKMDRFE